MAKKSTKQSAQNSAPKKDRKIFAKQSSFKSANISNLLLKVAKIVPKKN